MPAPASTASLLLLSCVSQIMMDRVTSFGFITIPVATLPLVAYDSLIHNGPSMDYVRHGEIQGCYLVTALYFSVSDIVHT